MEIFCHAVASFTILTKTTPYHDKILHFVLFGLIKDGIVIYTFCMMAQTFWRYKLCDFNHSDILSCIAYISGCTSRFVIGIVRTDMFSLR